MEQPSLNSIDPIYSYRSPINYPGGKKRAVEILRDHSPDTDFMVSPFMGGGHFEIYMAACGVKVHGYDILEPLVNFWNVALTQAKDIADMAGREYPPMIDRTQYKEAQERYHTATDPLERAMLFYVLNRNSYGALGAHAGMVTSTPNYKWHFIENMRRFKCPNLSVGLQDFKDTMARYPDCYMYLDPPYYQKGKLYGYGDNMTFDHEGLHDMLRERKGKWMLSYNNIDYIKDLYSDYWQAEPKWLCTLGDHMECRELLIKNF